MSNMTILQWAEVFIKYKDAVKRQNESVTVDEKNNKIVVLKKNGVKEVHVCVDDLDVLVISELSNEKVACLNKRSNLDWLIKNWNEIIKTKAAFTFVNPAMSESWSIHPQLHHHITDKVALKPGLLALFNSISKV